MNLHIATCIDFANAASEFATSDQDSRGAVFTRREVVDLILDLVGYTEGQPLARQRLLEPAAGHGDFLIPAIGRLVRSYLAHGGGMQVIVESLKNCLCAFEVHSESVASAQSAVTIELARLGLPRSSAHRLAQAWVREGDFLLAELTGEFTHIVGNPPYVRQELIPAALLSVYRKRYPTIYDRADLYVPFFERSLQLLSPSGRLGFICTDRWTKNKYGGPLRRMVAEGFALTHYVDLVDTPAFLTDVMTYPAITVLERPEAKQGAGALTRVAYRPEINAGSLGDLAKAMTATDVPQGYGVEVLSNVVNNSQPWVVHEPNRLALVRRLEACMPTLEAAGCKVGIGVATGADGVYIQPFESFDVEPSRKLPLVRTKDLKNGKVAWQGMAVLNPFEPDGSLADLRRYPRLARYLKRHAEIVKGRNVSKRNTVGWYRTIDRIYPELARVPKLLIPDIKGNAHVVFEDGQLYPHHNLYYVVSEDWNLRALQAVLMSGIARLFVATYSTTMRGGYLRFQAQYLRRIRVPFWTDVSPELRRKLSSAAERGDSVAANDATAELFSLTQQERTLIETA